MKNREKTIFELRPELELEVEHASEVEKFQNITLRPILKYQNDLFVNVFSKYIEKRKNKFYGMDVSDKHQFIEQSIKQDVKFKNLMIGIVIGLFSLDELEFYQTHETELNRRITTMLVQRLKSMLDQFN
ncbi:MAG: hypothetical protein ACI97N_002528 [Cognaticolwellia sp.]|jgi:hypothetical protein